MAQLDTGPITTKGSVLSPDDMLSPDEMEEEEEFVSKALLKGTIINERFKILRLINEKREKNTYVVKDTLTTGKKFILKGSHPPSHVKRGIPGPAQHLQRHHKDS